MGMFDLETTQLSSIDWNRHSIGFGPKIKDEEQQLRLGTLALAQEELKVLRLLLTREIGGEIPAQVYPGLKMLTELVASWEQWSVDRGMP